MLYAVVTCGWLFVLVGGAIVSLTGGDSWSAVGEIALFLQLGGWVRALLFTATSLLTEPSTAYLHWQVSCACVLNRTVVCARRWPALCVCVCVCVCMCVCV